MYVSKAGSLLQGGIHFDFLLNHGISSVSPSDSWKNSFKRSLLKNCWISFSNWNRSIFDGFGKNERPLESKSFSSLEREILEMFTTILWSCILFSCFFMMFLSTAVFVLISFHEKKFNLSFFLHLMHSWTSVHSSFNILAFYKAFFRILCALCIIDVIQIIFMLNVYT